MGKISKQFYHDILSKGWQGTTKPDQPHEEYTEEQGSNKQNVSKW